jgi:hypothetical protein
VKSTNLSKEEGEILSAPPVEVGNMLLVSGQIEKEDNLALPTSQVERENNGWSGAKGGLQPCFLNNDPESVGPANGPDVALDDLERVDPSADPIHLDSSGPGLMSLDPPFRGLLVEEGFDRYSSISKPEDVLTSHKAKAPKSKVRKQKAISKFNQLGVPKCLKLVEVVKESG